MSSSRPVFRSRWLPYLLVAPQLVITVIFFIWPAGEALWYSVQSVDPFGLSSQFVGLDNFTALFHDSYYLDSFWTTMKFSALVTVSGLVASLFFAALVDYVVRGSRIYQTLMLTSAVLLSRVIGISFRVYMSNKIGAEGIGLYQLICTIFLFASTFVTSGVSLAVTRLVTEALARKEYQKAKTAVRRALVLGLFFSLLMGGALFFSADYIGNQVLKDPRTILSLKILAPSLPFMAVSACFRGYFFAVRQVIKTASEQLLEQIAEIVIFALVVNFLAPMGLEYACCAIVLGTTGAEIFSCLYSFLLYWGELRKLRGKASKGRISGGIKKLLSICLPVTASSCLRSGLSMTENILIPPGLKKNGASYEGSLAGYGMITGMVMPVITFPSAFLSSFSMLLIPELSEANAANHKKNIHYIAGRVFQITFLFSIFICGFFVFFAKDLGLLIYHDSAPGVYLSVLAPVIPLMYLDSVVDGMLKGLNEQLSYLSYNIIDSVMRVGLILFLLPLMGLNGLIVVIFASEILNSTLSIARLMKVTQLKMRFFTWILKPALAVVFPGLLLMGLSSILSKLLPDVLFRVLFELIFTVGIYLLLLFAMKSLTKDDIRWLKSIFRQMKQ